MMKSKWAMGLLGTSTFVIAMATAPAAHAGCNPNGCTRAATGDGRVIGGKRNLAVTARADWVKDASVRGCAKNQVFVSWIIRYRQPNGRWAIDGIGGTRCGRYHYAIAGTGWKGKPLDDALTAVMSENFVDMKTVRYFTPGIVP